MAAESALHEPRHTGDERRELHAEQVEMIAHREVEEFIAMETEAGLRQRMDAEHHQRDRQEQAPRELRSRRAGYRRGAPTMGAIGVALLGGSMVPVAPRHASPV